MTDLKRTALYERHLALGAKMVPFAGWEMPLRYSGDLDEVKAVRESAGLFDVSHMGQVEIRGPSALRDVNHLVTNDVAKAEAGQAIYTMMCNERGGVIDDLIVYKNADDHIFIVVNASRAEADIAWMKEHLSDPESLIVIEDYGIIALQGPESARVLSRSCRSVEFRGKHSSISDIPRRFIANVEIAGHVFSAARTGYTGEDGFELFPKNTYLRDVWEVLMNCPDVKVKPCGLGARDVCRLEAGLRLYGNDLSEDVTPLEAGLKWTVKFDKDDFIGKAALQTQLAEGRPRKTIGLKMLDRAIPRRDYVVAAEGDEVGVVTSGIFSPTLKVGIAMALVISDVPDNALFEVIVRGESHPAEVVKMPFVCKPM